MPYPNVGFQITTKRRDELVHQILNDVFREKVAGFFVCRRHDHVMRPLLSCEGPRRTLAGCIIRDLAIFCGGTGMRVKTGAGKGKFNSKRQ